MVIFPGASYLYERILSKIIIGIRAWIKGLRPVLEGIVTTNPDRLVLITIITWHFQFLPVNVSILHLKYDYRARSESRFACYTHCYVTWYPLTMGIVASQCPSARNAVLVTRYLIPIKSACLTSFLRIYCNKTYLQRICKHNWRL